MLIFRRTRRFLASSRPVEYLVPLIGGCAMLVASFLPWLEDPLGEEYSAWNLPVNLGWPLHSAFFSYGVICATSACYALSIAYANWRAGRRGEMPISRFTVGLLCLVPVGLFLLQYLFTDLGAVAQLVQHKTQISLTQKHFGYRLGKGFIPLGAFLDISNVGVRLQLLADQVQIGALCSLIGAWMILDFKRLKRASSRKKRPISRWLARAVLLLLFVVIGKGIGGEICQNLAGNAIAAGNYSDALQWLDRAAFLNPSFKEVSFYHIERGQVVYLMNPDQRSDESRAYVASLLVDRQDYQDAYQQLFVIWQANKKNPWVVDQISDTLEYLAESPIPAHIRFLPQTSQNIVTRDSTALPWLQLLIHVNPRNVYARYVLGRIAYDLGNYAQCRTRLTTVLDLSPNADLQSSVYTYLALSDARQGNYKGERELLLLAEQLDPNYRNLTAREELSGLH